MIGERARHLHLSKGNGVLVLIPGPAQAPDYVTNVFFEDEKNRGARYGPKKVQTLMYTVGCHHASTSSALRLFDQLKSEQIQIALIWQSSEHTSPTSALEQLDQFSQRSPLLSSQLRRSIRSAVYSHSADMAPLRGCDPLPIFRTLSSIDLSPRRLQGLRSARQQLCSTASDRLGDGNN